MNQIMCVDCGCAWDEGSLSKCVCRPAFQHKHPEGECHISDCSKCYSTPKWTPSNDLLATMAATIYAGFGDISEVRLNHGIRAAKEICRLIANDSE